MDGISLGIAGDGREIFRYRMGDVKREMGLGDKRGGEGEREGRICLRGLYVRVSPSVSPLVGLSIGGSVEWLISWSVMLLLRTRGDKLLIVGIPVL